MKIAVPCRGEVVAVFLGGRGVFENQSEFQIAPNVVSSALRGNTIEPCNVSIRHDGFRMVFEKLVRPEFDVLHYKKPFFWT